MRENPALIISFNTDDAAQYKVVNESMERLKLANALRVSFTTMPRGRVADDVRQRRLRRGHKR